MEQQAFSVNQFCAAHGISRALFYVLAKDGRAPRVMKVGRRALITTESAAEWRQRMESATTQSAS